MNTNNLNNQFDKPPMNNWENTKGILSEKEISEERKSLINLEEAVQDLEKKKTVNQQIERFSTLLLRREELTELMSQRKEIGEKYLELKKLDPSSDRAKQLYDAMGQLQALDQQIKQKEQDMRTIENSIQNLKLQIIDIQKEIDANRDAVNAITQQYITPAAPVNNTPNNQETTVVSTGKDNAAPELVKLQNDREEMGREYIRLKQSGARQSVLDDLEQSIAQMDTLIQQKKKQDSAPVATSTAPSPVNNITTAPNTPDAIPFVGFSGQFPSESGQVPGPEALKTPEVSREQKRALLDEQIIEARLQWLEAQKQEEVRLKGGLYSRRDAMEKRSLEREYNRLKMERINLYGPEETMDVVTISRDPKTGFEVQNIVKVPARYQLINEEVLGLNADRIKMNIEEGRRSKWIDAMAGVNKIMGIPGKLITSGLVGMGMDPVIAQKAAPWVNRFAFAGVAAATGGVSALGALGMVGMSGAVGTVVATTLGWADKIAQKLGFRDKTTAEVHQNLVDKQVSMQSLAQAEAFELDKQHGSKKAIRDFVKVPAAIGLGSLVGGVVAEQVHDAVNTCDDGTSATTTPTNTPTPAPAVESVPTHVPTHTPGPVIGGGNPHIEHTHSISDVQKIDTHDYLGEESVVKDIKTTDHVAENLLPKYDQPVAQSAPQPMASNVHNVRVDHPYGTETVYQSGQLSHGVKQIPNQAQWEQPIYGNQPQSVAGAIVTQVGGVLREIFRRPDQVVINQGGHAPVVYDNPYGNQPNYGTGGLNHVATNTGFGGTSGAGQVVDNVARYGRVVSSGGSATNSG